MNIYGICRGEEIESQLPDIWPIFNTLVLLPYTLYTAQFQYTRHSLELSDNDWLFPHPCVFNHTYLWTKVAISINILVLFAFQMTKKNLRVSFNLHFQNILPHAKCERTISKMLRKTQWQEQWYIHTLVLITVVHYLSFFVIL